MTSEVIVPARAGTHSSLVPPRKASDPKEFDHDRHAEDRNGPDRPPKQAGCCMCTGNWDILSMTRRTILSAAAVAPVLFPSFAWADGGAGPGSPVTALLILRVKPGRGAKFLALLTPVLDAMRRETTFLNAILHQDPQDPSRFLLYETWTDRRDLVEVQMRRAYRDAYWAALPELLAEPRQVSVWTPLRTDLPPGFGQR
jgi:quinol monooxygenase YgiN